MYSRGCKMLRDTFLNRVIKLYRSAVLEEKSQSETLKPTFPLMQL